MGDAEMVKEFLVESYENLDRLDRDLLELKKDPTARDVLASTSARFTLLGNVGVSGLQPAGDRRSRQKNLLSTQQALF